MKSEITDAEAEAFLKNERSALPRPISPLPDRQGEGEKDFAALLSIGGVFPLHTSTPQNLEACCDAYPLATILPLLSKYGKNTDQDTLKRLWPWTASAVVSWRGTSERAAISEELAAAPGKPINTPWYFEPKLKPSEVKSRFDRISKNARQIVEDIRELTQAANTTNPHQQSQAKHLATLVTAMTLGVDYNFHLEQFGKSDLSQEILMKADASRVELQASLSRLSTLSALLSEKVNPAVLAHAKPGSDPALPLLVGLLAHVWKVMRGKSPSISRPKRSGVEQASPFVEFVLEVASVGRSAPQGAIFQTDCSPSMPTVDSVETAVKNLRK